MLGLSGVGDQNQFPLRGLFDWHAAWLAQEAYAGYPAGGANVASWADGSDNGRAASQATAGRQPVFIQSDAPLGSQPCLNFSFDVLVTDPLTLAQPLSVVIVARAIIITAASFNYLCGSQGGGGGANVDGVGAANGFGGVTGFTDGTNAVVAPGTEDTAAHLFVGYFDGASSFYERDGVRTNGTLTGAYTADPACLGAADTAANLSLRGRMAFMGIIAGDVTTHGSWPTFESWVTSKFGIVVV